MSELSDEGRNIVADLANRHGFSVDAVTTLLHAVSAGYGTQAQFSHPEFGGMGQWSSGGMIMIGDMFNNALAGRVAALCHEISTALQWNAVFAPPSQAQSQGGPGTSLFVEGGGGDWWPPELGSPASTGAQNDLRYAYFPDTHRLAISLGGSTTVYDTGPHQIGGFSQQQGGDQSLTFTSQLGLVRVADLPVVTFPGNPPAAIDPPAFAEPAPSAGPPPLAEQPAAPAQSPPESPAPAASDEIVALIEKLAELHAKGVLTDAEFEAKK
ncbi:MAG: SHOCT domain-containing protein, partial [Pseudomonadota bacterium]